MQSLDTLIGEFRQFKRTQEDFNEKHADKMEQVLMQVTKTNGRVNELDKFKEEVQSLSKENSVQKGKNYIMKDVWRALGAIGLLLLGYLLNMIIKH